MKRAFILKDEKSNKFWTIDCSGTDFCVHYGKLESIGKYEIKEFDTEEECVKEANKLIVSKQKKGYVEDVTFDFNNFLYLDTEDIGLHPKTSHPRFAAHFTDEFYYDCGDEETPFGSDEGADTLAEIAETIRKKPAMDFSAFPRKLIEEIWDMQYISIDTLEKESVLTMFEKQEMDMQQSDMVTYATAFAQIKITGKINPELKENALRAIKRYAIMYNEGEVTPIQQTMYQDLESFEAINPAT